jgi:hypothetical protein
MLNVRTTLSMLPAALLMLGLTPAAAAGQSFPPIPDRAPGTVTLPVTEYDRLVDRAAAQPAQPDQPPIPAVVARAELAGRVDADVARGTLRLEGEVFQRGAVKVPLVSSTTLIDARSDGRVLPLVQDGEVHSAILTGPAPFAVVLEWTASIALTPGRASVVLPQAASGTGTATLDLPGEAADVRVEAGLITEQQASNRRTVVRLTLTPGSRTRVSWSVRENAGQATPVEVRTLGEIKSLVTIGDGDLRLSSLIDVVIVRGEPRAFDVQLPAGYTLASASGATLDRYDVKGDTVQLTVREPERRRHQFVLTMEQPHGPGSFKAETSFPTMAGVQRESGELAIEGLGTMEVTPSADDTLRRMDVREINPALRSLTRQPLLAAFRYQRRPGEARRLALDVKRFPDAPVLSAIAERAMATTLVTSEGRMLTEMTLWIRNRAQPFMKVTLPSGASILSTEVAGETARPVSGADGTRVPLLRANFRPDGPYMVSFVYLHGSQPLVRSGDAQMVLATVDIPVTLLEWEVFLPGQFSAKPIAGNVMPVRQGLLAGVPTPPPPPPSMAQVSTTTEAAANEIIGRVIDEVGSVIPGVTIALSSGGQRRTVVVTDPSGLYRLSAVPVGPITVTSELLGFSTGAHSLVFDGAPRRIDFRMAVAGITETVQVASEATGVRNRLDARDEIQQAPSQNVVNMQRKVAGVLPVRIDVPRAGTSYRFIRPLVLDEQTTVSLRYKRR